MPRKETLRKQLKDLDAVLDRIVAIEDELKASKSELEFVKRRLSELEVSVTALLTALKAFETLNIIPRGVTDAVSK